jgi:hypothetical protein
MVLGKLIKRQNGGKILKGKWFNAEGIVYANISIPVPIFPPTELDWNILCAGRIIYRSTQKGIFA